MIVWLWDAYGPERRVRGVTDGGEEHALRAAEEALRTAAAAEVVIEKAYATLDTTTLENGYQRTGEGRHGRITHAGGPVAWDRLTAADALTFPAGRF